MEEISKLVVRYAAVPVAITAIYALVVYKKLARELQIFCWFIFVSAMIQVVAEVLWFQSRNNLPLLHLYVASGFLCLSWFYGAVLKGIISRKLIIVVAVAFTLFAIVNGIFIQGIFTYASHSLTVESVLIIILTLSTFILLLDESVKESRARIVASVNWINSGLFLYYSSSLLIFYFGEIITHNFSRTISLYTWTLHFFFMTVMYACFFVGLWKQPKN